MNSIARPWLSLSILLLCSLSPLSLSSPAQRRLLQSSSPSPQNLQVFPSTSVPAFINPPPPPPSPDSSPPRPAPAPAAKNSDSGKIAVAVVATAACTFAVSGLLFFAFYRYTEKKRRMPEPRVHSSDGAGDAPMSFFRSKQEPKVKGVIVDDNGLDAVYLKSLVGSDPRRCEHCKGSLDRREQDEEAAGDAGNNRSHWRRKNDHRTQQIPLLPPNSIHSSSIIISQSNSSINYTSSSSAAVPQPAPPAQPKSQPLPPPSPPIPQAPPMGKGPAPPPPPPMKKGPAPPPPPPPRKAGAAPPPPPPAFGAASSSKPPAAPAAPGAEGGRVRPRLKPLHWDKLTPANAGRSMVWDRINDGSIRYVALSTAEIRFLNVSLEEHVLPRSLPVINGFDEEQIEALFGYSAANRKPPRSGFGEPSSDPAAAQIFLLDARKSQNIAIVLRTLAVSRHEILDALRDGHGLAPDVLEKLYRIAPSKDEQTLILNFSGDPSRLADAESFLFHILAAVPSAFTRVTAMNFRSSVYDPEIRHLKLWLRTLELACRELRTRSGLFLKLLEAILKAGNRMNAGTARGNAQAFDLTALRKLSDVKSTDGKTSLLHFVVEEVVRSEGKHCAALNRSQSMIRRTGSRSAGSSGETEANRQAREEREREYIMLGLPAVGGLSVEFMNVKKAAAIDHDALAGGSSALAARVAEIRRFLQSSEEEEDGFAKEMKGFVEAAAMEIDAVVEEQERVMEIVRRTTEYYQPGAAKDQAAPPLQLFVIVRDFLSTVDHACVDITRNLQKKKLQRPAVVSSAEGKLPAASGAPEREKRITTRFPNLPARFLSENDSVSSSDSEDGF
ncbi:Formin-like protein 8 [Apostasia shenzhenica]|uniref:Formin-like protein n=1 Tax=Apostasia shenzhenica TaxID=1088818 RepID=A0A2I0BDJ1_9ASPA|nr:Formin-like protein 8 [Apostasia shenzhenica]